MGGGRVRHTQRVIGTGDAASSDVDGGTGDVYGGGNDEGLGAGLLDGSTSSSG